MRNTPHARMAYDNVHNAYKKAFILMSKEDKYPLYRFSLYKFHCAWKEIADKEDKWFQYEKAILNLVRRNFPKKGTCFILRSYVNLLTGITVSASLDTKVVVQYNVRDFFSFP